MKILNLYAGIGGNRRLWPDSVSVTAVEYNPEIAAVYQSMYPNDTVIVADAHEYLREHYQEFDYIWSSPPCQSHSRIRFHLARNSRCLSDEFPDMRLYQEILFLQHHARPDQKWLVENVIPYYSYLIQPTRVVQRHALWSNHEIAPASFPADNLRAMNRIGQLEDLHGVSLKGYKIGNKRQILRNMVSPKIGQYLLCQAYPEIVC